MMKKMTLFLSNENILSQNHCLYLKKIKKYFTENQTLKNYFQKSDKLLFE